MEANYFAPTAKESRANGISSEDRKNSRFSVRLRELRKKSGKSQAQLAVDLNVTKSTISLYETGDNVPDARTIQKMAILFGVSGDYLLGLTDVPSTDKDLQFICDSLGFTEEAANFLVYVKEEMPILNEFFNTLFSYRGNDLFQANSFIWSAIQISRLPIEKANNTKLLRPEIQTLLLPFIKDGAIIRENEEITNLLKLLPPGMMVISTEDAEGYYIEKAKGVLGVFAEEFIKEKQKEAFNGE